MRKTQMQILKFIADSLTVLQVLMNNPSATKRPDCWNRTSLVRVIHSRQTTTSNDGV